MELRWLKPIAPGTIEIRAGDIVRTIDVREATDRVTLDGLHIPQGEFAFSATHHAGKTHEGAYHATLIRR